jgi:hypothetical protein
MTKSSQNAHNYLQKLTLSPQRSEIKQAFTFHISGFKRIATVALWHSKEHQDATLDHPGSTTALIIPLNTIQRVPGGKVNIPGGHSIGHSKKRNLYEHVSYSELFPIFGAQYFPSLPLYDQSRQPTDASHRFTCFRQWRIRVGERENIARQIQNTSRQISETGRTRTHVYVNFFLRMTDTMTSQNIDLSSWDTLYN